MTPEQFDEWSHSDELDGTVTGESRLMWTIANGFAQLAAADGIDVAPETLIPGETVKPFSQSAGEQQAIFQHLADLQDLAAGSV